MKLDSRAPLPTLPTPSLLVALVALVAGCGGGCGCDPTAPAVVEWSHYAADHLSSKYSPASQIDARNVGSLEVA